MSFLANNSDCKLVNVNSAFGKAEILFWRTDKNVNRINWLISCGISATRLPRSVSLSKLVNFNSCGGIRVNSLKCNKHVCKDCNAENSSGNARIRFFHKFSNFRWVSRLICGEISVIGGEKCSSSNNGWCSVLLRCIIPSISPAFFNF